MHTAQRHFQIAKGHIVATRLKADERQQALIRAARKLFTKKGYEATRMEEVASAAKCTTGPLYHFFKTKRDLFEAALQESMTASNQHIVTARVQACDTSPLDRLQITVDCLLDQMSAPETRMFLRETPKVLGYEQWYAIRSKLMHRSFEADLRDAMIAGEISPEPPGPLAGIICAAIIEANEQVKTGHDDQVEPYRQAIHRMIERLKPYMMQQTPRI